MTADKMWALQEAAKPSGFTPNARGTADFLKSLEREGLLIRSERGPVWMITDAGRQALAELEAPKG